MSTTKTIKTRIVLYNYSKNSEIINKCSKLNQTGVTTVMSHNMLPQDENQLHYTYNIGNLTDEKEL